MAKDFKECLKARRREKAVALKTTAGEVKGQVGHIGEDYVDFKLENGTRLLIQLSSIVGIVVDEESERYRKWLRAKDAELSEHYGRGTRRFFGAESDEDRAFVVRAMEDGIVRSSPGNAANVYEWIT